MNPPSLLTLLLVTVVDPLPLLYLDNTPARVELYPDLLCWWYCTEKVLDPRSTVTCLGLVEGMVFGPVSLAAAPVALPR